MLSSTHASVLAVKGAYPYNWGVPKHPTRPAKADEPLHQLTVRISQSLNARLEAVAVVTDRTYRDIAETAINEYLRKLKLTPEQQRKVNALLG